MDGQNASWKQEYTESKGETHLSTLFYLWNGAFSVFEPGINL